MSGFGCRGSGVSVAAGQKGRQVNQKKETWDHDCQIGCCWVSQFAIITGNVDAMRGWVEYNETQRSMAKAQPNLRKAIRTNHFLLRLGEAKPPFDFQRSDNRQSAICLVLLILNKIDSIP